VRLSDGRHDQDDDDGGELAELVSRARSRRDANSFATVIRRCERMALAVAYAHLGDASRAADAVQEALLKAWQKLGGLEDPARFRAWLCHIVRNVAVDLRRQFKPTEDIASRDESALAGGPTSDDLDSAERRERVAAALSTLDDVSRSVVVLRYYEDLSSREIGELLGLSAAAVDMRLTRARQQLRPLLAAMIEGPAIVSR
jgi:RNA polymerase sigma-70 factor (ECF subfamily)